MINSLRRRPSAKAPGRVQMTGRCLLTRKRRFRVNRGKYGLGRHGNQGGFDEIFGFLEMEGKHGDLQTSRVF